MRLAVEQHTSLLKRDAEVRVKVWMTKLSEQVKQMSDLTLCTVLFPANIFQTQCRQSTVTLLGLPLRNVVTDVMSELS